MDNQEKLNKAVKLSQSYILLFLREYMDSNQLSNIESLFQNCLVVLESVSNTTTEFGNRENIGGFAQDNKIVIDLDSVSRININNENELNQLLGTIIHEYAHKIRAINSEYGEMLEESFASIFAEVCINNARIKLNEEKENKEIFGMLDSVKYQKYESQVRALLYVLKQNDLDKQLIVEYIAGSEEKFKQECLRIFGTEFNDYFNSINSKINENSEQLLINIINTYIKEHKLNISDYWSKDGNKLSEQNLYFRGSPTLCKSIVSVGKENYSEEEQEYYKFYESSVNLANENNNFINQERVDSMRNFIGSKFSLQEKTPEEIYDTIIDLCSMYIQHKNKDDEESRIFLEEIKKTIPDIDDFKSKFINLRVSGQDTKIFNGLDLDNVTYDIISSNMNKLLQIENVESENLGGIKR